MVSPRRGFAPSPLRFVWWHEQAGAAGGGGRRRASGAGGWVVWLLKPFTSDTAMPHV